MFALDVGVKSVIHGKLPCKSLFIGQSHRCESLRNRAEANALGSSVLLSLYIRRSHNEAESLHGWIGDRIVLDDRLKSAPGTAVIEFYRVNLWRIKRSRILLFCLAQQIFFLDKQ